MGIPEPAASTKGPACGSGYAGNDPYGGWDGEREQKASATESQRWIRRKVVVLGHVGQDMSPKCPGLSPELGC